jgi:hypothetical protein
MILSRFMYPDTSKCVFLSHFMHPYCYFVSVLARTFLEKKINLDSGLNNPGYKTLLICGGPDPFPAPKLESNPYTNQRLFQNARFYVRFILHIGLFFEPLQYDIHQLGFYWSHNLFLVLRNARFALLNSE